MAEPLSKFDKSTRDPWTDGGAEPNQTKKRQFLIPKPKKKKWTISNFQTEFGLTRSIPVYEKRPDGLLRGRIELIVLALRCNELAAAFNAFESS